MAGRPKRRLYDHDEARRLYAEGWTKSDLARKYGVTSQSLGHVVDPEVASRHQARWNELMQAVCEDCGAPITKNWYSARVRLDRTVCHRCLPRRTREENLLARLDADGLIHCEHCGEYRDAVEYRFAGDFPVPRCRPCETAARTAYRRAHREEERAYDRMRKRRQREDAA